MHRGVLDTQACGLAACAEPLGSASDAYGLSAFQRAMGEISQRVLDVDIRHYEGLPAESSLAELHPLTRRLVDEALLVVSAILALCESAAPEHHDDIVGLHHEPFLPFERAIDAVVEAGGASIAAVADVAFLVQLELRQRGDRLARVGQAGSLLIVIGECDSALRRVRKGLEAIDTAVARATGVAPLLHFSSELDDSLLVRGAYAKLRERILLLDRGKTGPVLTRLRAAGTHIAILAGWDAYPLLRVRDRLQLRELQQRILSQLLPQNRDDEAAGVRLWQDVVAFVEMLSQVNRRQELVDHDTKLLGQMLAAVPDRDVPLDETAKLGLRHLVGIDDELDAFIAAKVDSGRMLRPILARVGGRYGVLPREVP